MMDTPLSAKRVGYRDGVQGRPPVPHIHWLEKLCDAYSQGWNEGSEARAAAEQAA